MIGFSFLYLCVLGIGALFPISKHLGFPSSGLRVILGFLALPVLLYILHNIINLNLPLTCQIISIVAVLGLLKLIVKQRQERLSYIHWSHPIVLLPIATLLISQWNSGVSYIPYSGDEFSGWLTIRKQAFALGEFDRTQMRTAVTDYVPSWYLLILFTPTIRAWIYRFLRQQHRSAKPSACRWDRKRISRLRKNNPPHRF